MPVALKKSAPSRYGRTRRCVNVARRMDWMLREAACMAKPGAERETLEFLFQEEVDRMRATGKSAEAIAEFQAVAAIHADQCDGTP